MHNHCWSGMPTGVCHATLMPRNVDGCALVAMLSACIDCQAKVGPLSHWDQCSSPDRRSNEDMQKKSCTALVLALVYAADRGGDHAQ